MLSTLSSFATGFKNYTTLIVFVYWLGTPTGNELIMEKSEIKYSLKNIPIQSIPLSYQLNLMNKIESGNKVS